MRLTDSFIKAGLLSLLLFTPLAFGTVHAWAYSLAEGIIALMILAWAINIWVRRDSTAGRSNIRARLFALPLVLFIAFVLFQMTPLSSAVLRVVSPSTYDLYANALPGWPDRTPYAELLSEIEGTEEGEREEPPSDAGSVKNSPEVRSPRAEGRAPSSWLPLSIAPELTQADLLKFVGYTLLFFLVLLYPAPGTVRDTSERIEYEIAFVKPILYTILFAGFLVAALGFLNLFTWNGKVLWFFVPHDANGGGAGLRAASPFIAPPSFANYLAMGLPLMVMATFWRSFLSPGRFSAGFRVLCGFAAFVLFCGILLSLSRAGWVASILGVCVLLLFMVVARGAQSWIARTPVRRLATFSIAGFCLFLVVALFFIGPRGQENIDIRLQQTATEPTSLYGRFAVWRDSLGMVRDFPVLGVGLGAWPDLYPRYQDPSLDGFYREAHNDYLEVLAETGAVGALLLVWFFGLCIGWILKNVFLLEDNVLPVVAALFAGMSAMAFHEIFDFNLQIPANAILFTILLAVALRLASLVPAKSRGRDAAVGSKVMGRAGKATAAAVLAGVATLLFASAFSQPMQTYPYYLRRQSSGRDALAAIRAYPANAEAHIALFDVFESKMNLRWQLDELRRILLLAPGKTAVRDAHAARLFVDGRREQALEEVTRSVAQVPSINDHFYLTRRVAPVLFPSEQEAIIAGFRQALADRHPSAFANLAEFYQRTGRFADRASLYEGAAADVDDPEEKADYLLQAADAAVRAGDLTRAEGLLRVATSLKPDDTALFVELIEKVYVPRKDLAGAQRAVADGIKNGADPLILQMLLAEAARSSGNRELAVEVLEQALANGSHGTRLPQEQYRTLIRIARVAASLGQDDVQERALNRAIELQPNSYRALMEVGSLHAARKDYNRAAFYYRNATRANGTSADAFVRLAVIEEARFRFADADEAYAEAVRLAPANDGLRKRYEAFKQRIANAIDEAKARGQ